MSSDAHCYDINSGTYFQALLTGSPRQVGDVVFLSIWTDERLSITFIFHGHHTGSTPVSPEYNEDINREVHIVDSVELRVVVIIARQGP